MSVLPAALKWPLALMPRAYAFLELIIDPACSTVFEAEPEEEDVMSKKRGNFMTAVFQAGPLFRACSGFMCFDSRQHIRIRPLSGSAKTRRGRSRSLRWLWKSCADHHQQVMVEDHIQTVRVKTTAMTLVFAERPSSCIDPVCAVPFRAFQV